jgi:hypothetical protein
MYILLLSYIYRIKRVKHNNNIYIYIYIYRIKRVRKQYYIMLAGLCVSTLPESSSGPQGPDPYSE